MARADIIMIDVHEMMCRREWVTRPLSAENTGDPRETQALPGGLYGQTVEGQRKQAQNRRL